MHWLSWHAETFARAAHEQKPILLSIAATWCRACHEMDRTTYTDSAVIDLVADRYVPIRVDADERPDIDDRYNLGGWPTTAFLTPDGALIGGGTYLAPGRMAGVLRQVADAFSRLSAEERNNVRRGRATLELPPAGPSIDAPLPDPSQVFASFDEECGGFGTEPKFPLTYPLLLAMAMYREQGDPRHRLIVERTLDAIAGGGLLDPTSGGYYRYATTRDWQLPHQEQLLDTNARLLATFAEAATTFERAVDRERTARLASFVESLALPDGGYAGSATDTRVFAGSTAQGTSALLAAAELAGDRALAQSVLGQFEAFVLKAYRPGGGIAHSVEHGTRSGGLLADHVHTGLALLAAFAVTGDEPYRMMAEELGHYALRVFAAPGGGFFDRAADAADIGLLKEPRIPYGDNCDAAMFFARLSRASREADFTGVAQQALDRVATLALRHGPDAAHWLVAARDVSIS
jgi:uncharacterized protein YyaL (SSP411 family)